MRQVGPDVFTWWTSVGLVIAVLLGCGWLLAFARALLGPFEMLERRSILTAAAAASTTSLVFGWLFVGAPALEWFLPGDWRGYHRVIAELSDSVLEGGQPSRWSDRAAFFYLMAVAHRLFGSSGFMTVVVNAAMAGTTVLLLADITRRLFDRRSAALTAILLAVLPAVPLWFGIPLREAMAITVMVALANLGVRIAMHASDANRAELVVLLAGSTVLAVVAQRTRTELAPVALLTLATAFGVHVWRWPLTQRLLRFPGALVVVGVGVLAASAVVAPRATRWLYDFAADAQVKFFNLHWGATSAIGGEAPLEPVTPFGLLLNAPVAIGRALLGPPPGTMLLVEPLFVLEAVPWWLLALPLALGLRSVLRGRVVTALVLVLPALAWAALSGWTVGNWGMMSRLRLMSWLLLLPIAARGALDLATWWVQRRQEQVTATVGAEDADAHEHDRAGRRS